MRQVQLCLYQLGQTRDMVKIDKSFPGVASDADIDDAENMPPGTLVWIYLRHSPGLDQSLESQEAAVMKLVEEKRWVVDRVFRDRWVSGSGKDSREQFDWMIHLSRQKPRPADVLIIWMYDRWARSHLHSGLYRSQLRLDGWKIHSMMDDIPPGPAGPLMEAIIDWSNEQFLISLRANTVRGLVYLAEIGCLPTGRPCRGYVVRGVQIGTKRDGSPRIGRRLEVDPETAPMIKKAFELKALGARHAAIAAETGLYAADSGSWTQLFRNRAYAGEYEIQGKVYTNVYPAIVSRELFDAVQRRTPKRKPKGKRDMRGRHHPRRKGSSFFLANIAVCAHCGGRMEGKRVKKYRYYICEHRNEKVDKCPNSRLIPADDVEREVVDALLKHVLTVERLQELLDWTNDALSGGWEELQLQLRKTEKELSDARSMAARMAVNFGTMDKMPESAEATLHRQDKLVKELAARVAELEWELDNSRIEVKAEQIEEYAERARAMIENGEFFDLREICEQLCVRIVMSREECRVETAFPIDAMGVTAARRPLPVATS
jgi:DNA invertase Pin-like site-specific DNA recombinase